MIIGNAKLFIDGAFFPGSLGFENGFITGILPADVPCDINAEGRMLAPGLVDIHTHGALDGDASDGDEKGLCAMARYHAKHGVTAFLATTMTLKEPELTRAMGAVRAFSRPLDGANLAGVHLEGPFLSYAKRGAQNPDNLSKPDFDMFLRLNDKSGGLVRLITVAPEVDEGFAFIKKAAQICAVSIGHTTADYAMAKAAFEAGASHVTHLFNAMPPLSHRTPGVIGAAFDAAGVSVELICDGVHIHDSVIRATHRLFGDRMCVISDSLRCAGMPDGEYELGGQAIVMKNGRATLLDGTIAGSSSNLLDELKVVVSCGIPLENALTCATASPAKAVGLDRELGSLSVGKRADMILLDENLNLHGVFIGGERV